MNQEIFSEYVYQYLLENHPLFLGNLEYKSDKSFECSLMSPTGKFSVWIATFDCEITIGMDDPKHTSGAHTHMSFYGEGVDEQTKAMTDYLHEIFNNKLVFIHSSLSGYTWTKDIVETLIEKEEYESIEFFTWTGEV
jgi:hypothetical protein